MYPVAGSFKMCSLAYFPGVQEGLVCELNSYLRAGMEEDQDRSHPAFQTFSSQENYNWARLMEDFEPHGI